MKAWRIHEHGGVENLKWEDIADRPLGENQARVRVSALGLNHLDLWVRKGVEGHRFPLPIIPGCDLAGTIVELGNLTDERAKNWMTTHSLQLNQRVLVDPILSCGDCRHCLSDFASTCSEFGLVGETTDGGAAEEAIVPIQNLLPLPDALSFEQAVTLPIAYTTAWTMLFQKARVQPGDLVLVQAAGSGVSQAAIQLAKMTGAQVATTAGSAEKVDKARALLGADFAIDYKKEDPRGKLKEWLKSIGRRGFDVVIDHVGEETFGYSTRLLDWGGRYAFCGATTGSKVEVDLKPLFFKNISILGTTMGSRSTLPKLIKLMEANKIQALIDREMKLEELPQAHEYLESRKAFGKVVLTRSD